MYYVVVALQAYTCGDFVMTAAEFTALYDDKGSCQSTCSLSSTGLSLTSQYYWAISDWSACSAACGGGIQDRAASCMNSVTSEYNIMIALL